MATANHPQQQSHSSIPTNVPPDAVVSFDLYAPGGLEQGLHNAWKALQAPHLPDLLWTTANGGHWIPTRAQLIGQFYRDHETFSSNITHVPRERSHGNHPIPSTLDPPEHTKYRTLINPTLSPKAVRQIEPGIRSLAVSLIETMKPKGKDDFVAGLASILPLQIFMDYARLPKQDLPNLTAIVQERIRPSGKLTAGQTLDMFRDYLRPYIVERLNGDGEDILSRLLRGKIDNGPMPMEKAELLCANLLIAGLDTVASMLGFSFHCLARSPALQSVLASDPSRIPAAVEELLRRHAIVALARVLTKDYNHNGVVMKQGDLVLLPTALAGLDETLFPNPLEIDLGRPRQESAAPFGLGVHRCPGSQLARLELRIVLEEWFARIPQFGLQPGARVEFRSGIVGSVTRLPLQWPS